MASGDPPGHPPADRGKGIEKPKKRRQRYVLRIVPPPPASVPRPPSSVPPPTGLITHPHVPSSSSQPPPTGLHNPVVAPRPSLSVPPLHMPSSNSSNPVTGLHPSGTPSSSPHTVPSPASVGGPSWAAGTSSPSPGAGDVVGPGCAVADPNAEDEAPLHDRPTIEPVGRG